MIRGIGVDLVRIARLEHWAADPHLLERFFHPGELADSKREDGWSLTSLAARFAAKEALGKALGLGLRGLTLKEIEVRKDEWGKPGLVFHGHTKELVDKAGILHVHLSLSHETDMAVAMVVIEG